MNELDAAMLFFQMLVETCSPDPCLKPGDLPNEVINPPVAEEKLYRCGAMVSYDEAVRLDKLNHLPMKERCVGYPQ